MKQCPSFPGYSADENGNIYSHRTRLPISGNKYGTTAVIDWGRKKLLSPNKNKKGRLNVSIRVESEGKIRTIGVHVLVADAFLGPKKIGEVVRHLDDNPSNNNLSNLAYGTNNDNVKDRIKNGGYKNGIHHHNAKLSNDDVFKILQLRKDKVKVKDIAAGFKLGISTIEDVIYGKTYKSIEFERCEKPENF